MGKERLQETVPEPHAALAARLRHFGFRCTAPVPGGSPGLPVALGRARARVSEGPDGSLAVHGTVSPPGAAAARLYRYLACLGPVRAAAG